MAGISNTLKYHGLNQAVQSGHTVKVAFYAAAATIDATTAAYSATNEVTQPGATPAINAGGLALSGRSISASDGSVATAYIDFDNPQITPNATFQFQKVLVYNDSTTPKYALWFHDYGSVQTWNSGTQYTLQIPDSGNGLLRIG
jgi:hypothetical protein